jgi:hypothetical protein
MVSEGGRNKSDILYLNIMFVSNYTQNFVFILFEPQTYYTPEMQAFRLKSHWMVLVTPTQRENTTRERNLFTL